MPYHLIASGTYGRRSSRGYPSTSGEEMPGEPGQRQALRHTVPWQNAQLDALTSGLSLR